MGKFSKESILKSKFFSPVKIVTVVFFILYAIFAVYLCRCHGYDSDKANHLLQARDVVSGNFFLNDWQLTGVTFLSTDLIYYEIGYIVFGVSYKAVCLAEGLMVASAVIGGYLLSTFANKENRILTSVLYFLLAGIPCQSYIASFRVHTGAVFTCFLTFLIVAVIFSRDDTYDNKPLYIVLGVLLFMGVWGDLITVLEGIIPIAILCVFRYLTSEKGTRRKYVTTGIVTAVAMGFGVVADKFYFMMSNADKNAYIADRSFTGLEEWRDRIMSFFQILTEFTMSDFQGKAIKDIKVLLRCANLLTVLIGVIVAVAVLVSVFRKKAEKLDDISVLLAFSVFMSFFAYVFTGLSARQYITIIPIALAVLIIRNLESIMDGIKDTKVFYALIILIVAGGFSVKALEVKNLKYPNDNTRRNEVIEFLEEKGLKGGYASFWDASLFTVSSGENVTVRHIRRNGNVYMPYDWFCKNSWYTEETHFVLINNTDGFEGANDAFGINTASVTSIFGEPDKIYNVADFIIYAYDENLAPKLNQKAPSLADGVFDASEMNYQNSASYGIDGLTLGQGAIAYGPYDTLEAGEYEIVFEGDNINSANVSMSSNATPEAINYEIVDSDWDSVTLHAVISDTVTDVEFVTENGTPNPILIESVTIEPYS